MKKIVLAAFLGALALFTPRPAAAITCPVVHTFVTGETLVAVNLNANPTQWANCFQNIDYRNLGAAGIQASQVIPQSIAQATFGGAFGYTIVPNSSTQVPLTIAGAAGQSVDIFDVTLTLGGARSFYVASDGSTHMAATFANALNVTSIVDSGTLSAAGITSTAGIAAGGALTGATTGAFSGNVVSGNGSANVQMTANGLASGTGAGSAFASQAGGTTQIAIGNKSFIFGTGYDATPYIYGSGTIQSNQAFSLPALTLSGPLTGATIINGNALALNGAIPGGSNGDISFGRTGGTAYAFMGTALATGGQFDFGATNAGAYTFQKNPSSPILGPIFAGGGTFASDVTLLGTSNVVFNSAALGGQIRGDGVSNLILRGGTAGSVYIQNNAGAQNNAHFPDPGGLILDRGGLTSTAPAQAASDGATRAYVPPVYNSDGTATASTMHSVIKTNVGCTTQSTGTPNQIGTCTITLVFTGASVFASPTSYGCWFTQIVGGSTSNVPAQPYGQSKSSTSDSVYIVSNTGSVSLAFDVICTGS